MEFEIFDGHLTQLESLSEERKEQLKHLFTELERGFLKFLKPIDDNITVTRSHVLEINRADRNVRVKSIKKFCIDYQKKLSLPEGWGIYLNNVKDKKTEKFLTKLKYSWLRSRNYVSYSSRALCHVAGTIIPKIEDEIHLASEELKTKRKDVDSKLYKQYKKYLENILKQIDTVKIALIEAILLRMLALTEKGDFSQSNMVIWFMHMLRDKGVLKQSTALPRIEYPFKPEELRFFNEYVFAHGNKQQRMRFVQMRWPSESSKLMLIQTKASLVTAPMSVYKAAFPNFSFSSWLRKKLSSYTWLVQEVGAKQYHLAQVMAMTAWGTEIIPGQRLIRHPTQKNIQSFSFTVDKELLLIDSRLSDMREKKWYFFNYKKRILVELKKYFLNVRDDLLARQLELLQSHCRNVRTKCMTGEIITERHVEIKDILQVKSQINDRLYEEVDGSTDPQSINTLSEKQQEIRKRQSVLLALMSECKQYIEESKKKIAEKQKSMDDVDFFKEAKIELDKLKKGILPQGRELNKLYHYHEYVKKSGKDFQENKTFMDEVKYATEIVYKNAKQHILMLSTDSRVLQLEQHVSLIFRADKIIREMGTSALQQRYAKFIQKQWAKYLIFIAERPTKNDSLDNAMLGLLDTIGDEVVKKSANHLRKEINDPVIEMAGARIKIEALRVTQAVFMTGLKKDYEEFNESFVDYLKIRHGLCDEAVNAILSLSSRMVDAKILKIEKFCSQITPVEAGLINLNKKKSIIPNLLEIRVEMLYRITYKNISEPQFWKTALKNKLRKMHKNEAKFISLFKTERKFENEVYEKMNNLLK